MIGATRRGNPGFWSQIYLGKVCEPPGSKDHISSAGVGVMLDLLTSTEPFEVAKRLDKISAPGGMALETVRPDSISNGTGYRDIFVRGFLGAPQGLLL